MDHHNQYILQQPNKGTKQNFSANWLENGSGQAITTMNIGNGVGQGTMGRIYITGSGPIQDLNDNRRERVRYICKEITEDEMKKLLYSKQKKIDIITSQLQIYELYNTIVSEAVIDIYNHSTDIIYITECLKKIERSRTYVNRELMKVSFLWKRSVKFITDKFEMASARITSQRGLDNYLAMHPLDMKATV